MAETYTCERCKGIFEYNLPEWTDEDARIEQETLFPGLPREQQAIVCDDCFKIVMKGVQ